MALLRPVRGRQGMLDQLLDATLVPSGLFRASAMLIFRRNWQDKFE